MTDFNDPHPGLPLMVDVGGEVFYLGSEKPVEFAYKSRKQFQDTFGKEDETERLIRKYLSYTLKRSFKFDSEQEKAQLINILKQRAEQLKESQQFSSSLLKNTMFKRTYINIQKLIEQIQGPEEENLFNKMSMPDISLSNIVPDFMFGCKKAQQRIRQLEPVERYKLAMELSWYLLHPDDVPKDVECDWAKLIKALDTIRIGDFKQTINSSAFTTKENRILQELNNAKSGRQAGGKVETELDRAKQLAHSIIAKSINESMKERVEYLLNALEARKFLNGSFADPSRLNIISSTTTSRPKLPENTSLDKPIGQAMLPLFDYFKTVYDPTYSLLESVMKLNGPSLDKVILPQLITILHICNFLNSLENKYGVYRITNVSQELLQFIGRIIQYTDTYVSNLKDDKESNSFNLNIGKLPKVRMTSLLNRYENNYKHNESVPYIQMFVMGNNLNVKARNEIKPELFEAATDFFKPVDLFISVSKPEAIMDNIPLNAYEINYDSVNIGETTIKVDDLLDNYFNLNKGVMLDEVTTIKPYVTFNDAELAMSILIGLKEVIPK